ncbi:MAG: hypothetical protein ABL862_01150 [Candidatus Nitrotoga sp.]
MKFIKPSLAFAFLLSVVVPTAQSASIRDDCRSYARAIKAVAEARDNLDQPSWDELLKLHPILKETEKKEGRGYLYASLISLRIINKNAAPTALMKESFESCTSGGFACLLYGQGCGPKDDK